VLCDAKLGEADQRLVAADALTARHASRGRRERRRDAQRRARTVIAGSPRGAGTRRRGARWGWRRAGLASLRRHKQKDSASW
jgi:hypothetical protein